MNVREQREGTPMVHMDNRRSMMVETCERRQIETEDKYGNRTEDGENWPAVAASTDARS